MTDEMVDYRALKKLCDCFLLLAPDAGGKNLVALKRLPTEKELQAAAESVGELECRAQMDSLDRQTSKRREY